jgi:uncharacterized protein YqhQ
VFLRGVLRMLLKTRIVTQLTKFALRRPDKDSAEDSLNKREKQEWQYLQRILLKAEMVLLFIMPFVYLFHY